MEEQVNEIVNTEEVTTTEGMAEEKREELTLTPAEQAAIDFNSMLPIFRKKLRTMPKKEVERLMVRMLEFPLNEKPYTFKNQKERELFFVARKLLDANLIMAAEVFEEKMNRKEEETKEVINEQAEG